MAGLPKTEGVDALSHRESWVRWSRSGGVFLSALSLGVTVALAGGAGTTGAELLRFDAGARSESLGQAMTAVPDGPNALASNPAGLAGPRSHEAVFEHQEGVLGTAREYGAVAFRFSTRTAVGISANVLRLGAFTGRDGAGRDTGAFGGSSVILTAGAARRVGRVAFGLSVKAIRETLAGYTAQTGAVDVGALVQVSRGLAFGAAVQNLGPGLTFMSDTAPLPRRLKLGGAARVMPGLLLTADAVLDDGRIVGQGGTEYLLGPVALRLGYAGTAVASRESAMPFFAGAGFRLGRVGLDYAFSSLADLGASHRFSMGFRFGR